jgi:glycosyltransferase involved in cell wall biosynthesis
MRIVFGVYGYSGASERLQPWLTLREVAAHLMGHGDEVHVITDTAEGGTLDGLRIHTVRSLRPSNAAEMGRVIGRIRPDKMVVLSTPMNLSGDGWYGAAGCELYAFLSYPFYTRSELLRAMPHIRRHDVVTYGKHALVPGRFWATTLRRHFRGLIGQSARTVGRVADAVGGDLERHVIRAGIDRTFWSPSGQEAARTGTSPVFLYLGSPKAIRGFDVLVSAFGRMKSVNACLRILARGAEDDDLRHVDALLARHCAGKRKRITVVGGWMDREALRAEIRAAHVVVLPFVLVPSELPVSVMECVACGTPVITTDIDGLPEAIGGAGMITGAGSIDGLAQAMDTLSGSPEALAGIRRECATEAGRMQSWQAMGERWRLALLDRASP